MVSKFSAAKWWQMLKEKVPEGNEKICIWTFVLSSYLCIVSLPVLRLLSIFFQHLVYGSNCETGLKQNNAKNWLRFINIITMIKGNMNMYGK